MMTKPQNGHLQQLLFVLSFLLFIASLADAKIPDAVLEQKKSVVTIYVYKDGRADVIGSGFIVDPDGVIATNYHVVAGSAKTPEVAFFVKMGNGAVLRIEELILFDAEIDIALLTVESKGLPAVRLSTNYKPEIGEDIIVIGSPFGLETTISNGIISGVRGQSGLIQITAPVSPGSSGSPVFNTKGEVIGIASFLIEGGQNLNFAIPVKYVANLLAGHNEKNSSEQLPAPAPTPEAAPAPAGARKFKFDWEEAPSPAPEAAPAPEALEPMTPELCYDWYQAALRKINIKDYAGALSLLEDLSGYLSLALEDPETCPQLVQYTIELCNKIIRDKPDLAQPHYILGQALSASGDNAGAIKAYQKAIGLKPDASGYHVELGRAYLVAGNPQKARQTFLAAVKKHLKEPQVPILFMIYAAYDIEHQKDAAETWQEIVDKLKANPKTPPGNLAEAYSYLGESYEQLGQYDKAIKVLSQAVKIEPDSYEYIKSLGDIYYAIDNYKQAIQYYEKALFLLSSDSNRSWYIDYAKSRVYSSLARSYYETGEYAKATNAYKKAIELDPKNTGALYRLGLAYWQLSQYPEAISVFSLYIEAKPDDPYAHYFLGRAYHENKNYDSARSAYLKAVQLKSDFPSATLSNLYFNLGLVYSELGRLEDEENAYKKALEIDKDNARALLNLGVCHVQRGQMVLAADYFYRAGIISLQRGDREKALGALNNLSLTDSPLYEKLYSKIYPDVPLKEKEKKK
ncbi:MAG: tetratricopeptide repeat protein [Deltaproteobacteria bacterium]|nr:tetratricopeptide repeat protein [Deltaproteobacteria bacterium]